MNGGRKAVARFARLERLDHPIQLAEKAIFFLETQNNDGWTGLAPVRAPIVQLFFGFLHRSVGDFLSA